VLDEAGISTVTSTSRAEPIDHSEEECPNFPGCRYETNVSGAAPMTEHSFSRLAVAGEDIGAGSTVVLAFGTNLLFSAARHAGSVVGESVEQIREGFRVQIKNGEVREDDA
jgi:hypothetical protein